MIGLGRRENSRGQLRLSAAADSAIAEINTYQKVSGIFTDGHCCDFSVEDSKLMYSGANNKCFLFTGTSEVKVNKPCSIFYALYKNGQLVDTAQTPHVFLASAKTESISITSLVTLNKNDYLEVFCKSDTAGTVLSVQTLNITLWGN